MDFIQSFLNHFDQSQIKQWESLKRNWWNLIYLTIIFQCLNFLKILLLIHYYPNYCHYYIRFCCLIYLIHYCVVLDAKRLGRVGSRLYRDARTPSLSPAAVYSLYLSISCLTHMGTLFFSSSLIKLYKCNYRTVATSKMTLYPDFSPEQSATRASFYVEPGWPLAICSRQSSLRPAMFRIVLSSCIRVGSSYSWPRKLKRRYSITWSSRITACSKCIRCLVFASIYFAIDASWMACDFETEFAR